MKIVCDTNVLVSGVLFGGNARTILRLVSRARVMNVISAPVLDECERVFIRPKFGLSQSYVIEIISLFRDTFELVIPSRSVSVVEADPDDNRILETALAGDCRVIVSGDTHLLDLNEWQNIKILSPVQFLDRFFPDR